VTDVRRHGMPPPSPHWRGPDAPPSDGPHIGLYESTRLRPGARSLAVPGALCMVLLFLQIAAYVVIAADWFLNRSYWGGYHNLYLHNPESDDVAKVMGHRYADAVGIGVGAIVFVFVIVVLTLPTFIWWFQRAYRNLARQQFHPAWAYFAWFVPILNIWRPKQLANRIWRGSVSPGLGFSIQWWWFGPWLLTWMPIVGYSAMYSAGHNGDYGAIGVILAVVFLLQATVPLAMLLMIRAVTRARAPPPSTPPPARATLVSRGRGGRRLRG
jgi:hypothetical protein